MIIVITQFTNNSIIITSTKVMKSTNLLIALIALILTFSYAQAGSTTIPNCLQYNFQEACEICEQGYEPSWNRRKCIKFEQSSFQFEFESLDQAQNKTCTIEDCDTCVSGNPQQCQNCSSTYSINSTDGTCFCNSPSDNCTACDISNCRVCSQADVCSDCVTNYDLNTNQNFCLSCNVVNCNTCSSSNVCNDCNTGEPALDGSGCTSNCPSGCQVCSNQNVCLGCSPGWLFNVAGSTCYQCNLVGCINCNAANTCEMCSSGYQLIGGNCIVCAPPCSQCNADGSCQSCNSPLYSSALNSGQCFQCQVQKCQTCQANNPTVCTTCVTGWVVSGSSCALQCTDSNCLTCSTTNANQCSACNNYYYVQSANATCQLCDNFPKCLTCNPMNPANCTLCNTGYWSNNGVCSQCPGWCATCTATTCTKVRASWGVVALNQQLTLAACDYGCYQCSSSRPSGCMKCLIGFSLNQAGNCLPCNSPCASCQDGNPSSCLSCMPGSVWISGSCSACNSSCKTCSATNVNQCTSCSYGVVLKNGQCSGACSENCMTCTSPVMCLSCQQGYGLNATNFCVPCLTSCAQCSGTFPTICLQCGTGFASTLNSQQQVVCNACPQNCMTCSMVNGQGICSQCYPGYTVNGGFTCSQTCNFPCATCQNGSPSICQSCFAGYTYNNAAFSCAAQTVFSNTSTTGICPMGYMLSTGACIQCVGNCAQCVTATNVCSGCRTGFYLRASDNNCISCPVGCAICTSLGSCQVCNSGFFLPKAVVMTPQVCQSCQFPCLTCYGFADQCTSCASGYNMQGWACVTAFNLEVSAVLDTTFTAFFAAGPNNSSNNYVIYLTQLQTASQSQSLNNISVSTLASGSISTTSAISVQQSNSNAVISAVSGLQSLLSSGTLGGSTVISFTIQASQGTLPTTGVNVTLILAICIPLAVILIVAIGILIYCKYKKSSNIIERKIKEDGLTVRETFELSNDITGRRLEAI